VNRYRFYFDCTFTVEVEAESEDQAATKAWKVWPWPEDIVEVADGAYLELGDIYCVENESTGEVVQM